MASSRKIHPLDASFSSVGSEEGENGLLQVFINTYHDLALAWYRCQIGNRRVYSVERMLAFRDYYGRTSTCRAIAVCILYPVPAFVTMFLFECIPLQDPTEGWKANSALWVRMLLSSFMVAMGMLFQFKEEIEPGVISSSRTVGVAAVSAVYYTGISIAAAASWKFPVPFGLVIMVIPFVTFVNLAFVLCIGPRVIKENAALQKQLLSHLSVACSQFLLIIVYPTFSAIFIRLSGPQQALFVMVLPTIKFALKQATAYASTHLQERVGCLIVFNVDVFNVLYVAMCMQTAQSVLTTALLVTSDAFHVALALRTIYYHTSAIQEQANPGWTTRNPGNYLEGMPAMVRVAFDESLSHSRSVDPIRVFAPIKLSVSNESSLFLQELANKRDVRLASRTNSSSKATAQTLKNGPDLAAISRQTSNRTDAEPAARNIAPTASLIHGQLNSLFPDGNYQSKAPSTVIRTRPKRRRSESIGPSLAHSSRLLLDNVRRASFVPLGAGPLPVDTKSTGEAVRDGLQALFHCEYVILAEYVECVLPLLYTVYLAGLFHLPTAAYYPHTRNLSHAKMSSTLVQLAVYGSLEFGSFVALQLMLKRRFGYSPIHQLAFVLETEAATLQSLLFGWIIFTLQLTLVHFGVDIHVTL